LASQLKAVVFDRHYWTMMVVTIQCSKRYYGFFLPKVRIYSWWYFSCESPFK